MESSSSRWHHAPEHRFLPCAVYFVTASTYRQARLFQSPERLDLLQETLLSEAERYEWNLQAWACFSNHYHFVALAPVNAGSLSSMLRAVHSRTAVVVNRLDGQAGRRVWSQFRDTCLTSERSYFARLNYTIRNPERHGVVKDAREYPWCSMAWFMERAEEGFRRAVMSFDESKVLIADDF